MLKKHLSESHSIVAYLAFEVKYLKDKLAKASEKTEVKLEIIGISGTSMEAQTVDGSTDISAGLCEVLAVTMQSWKLTANSVPLPMLP